MAAGDSTAAGTAGSAASRSGGDERRPGPGSDPGLPRWPQGVLRFQLRAGLPAMIANLEQHQQPSPQAAQRDRDRTVYTNESGWLEIAPKLLRRQRFRQAPRIVLAVVVVIHLLQLANEPTVTWPRAEADLEID